MQLIIKIKGKEAHIELDGKKETFKTAFLKRMSLNDLIETINRERL